MTRKGLIECLRAQPTRRRPATIRILRIVVAGARRGACAAQPWGPPASRGSGRTPPPRRAGDRASWPKPVRADEGDVRPDRAGPASVARLRSRRARPAGRCRAGRNRTARRRRGGQRRRPVVGGDDVVTVVAQEHGEALRGVHVVVHHQHRGGRGAGSASAAAFPPPRGSCRALRQRAAAPTNSLPLPAPRAARLHPSALQLDQVAHQGQADAEPARRPLARRSALDEELEDALEHLGRDPDARRRRTRITASVPSCDHAAPRCGRPGSVYARGVLRAGCRAPAPGAPGRRPRPAAPAVTSTEQLVAPLLDERPQPPPPRASTTSASATRSRRSSTRPRAIRETSSRSSTSRTMCRT